MESDNITFAHQSLQIGEALLTVVLTGRVVQQHIHSQSLSHSPDAATYMAYSHNAHTRIFRFHPAQALEQQKCSVHILLHSAGIASGTIAPCDTRLTAIIHIDMVKTNRCRRNKFHRTALQQFAVTTGTCTDN